MFGSDVKVGEVHDNLMEPDSMFSDTKNTGVTRDSFNVGIPHVKTR